MVKKSIKSILILCLVILFSQSVFAETAGFNGVNSYSSLFYGDCNYGNRAGASYVNNLSSALIGSTISTSFKHTDENANESHLRTDSVVNSVGFYAFSGHGLNQATYSTAHFYARSSGEPWHDAPMEDYESVNATTLETKFGHNKLKWVTMYSCNWLTNGGDTQKQTNIYKTFEGATLTMGFASIMYLDSREGTEYGNNIKNGLSFRKAFIEAAKKYQVQRTDGDSIARVAGYTLSKDDTATVYFASLPTSTWYVNSPSSYSVIETVTIPHTGNPI